MLSKFKAEIFSNLGIKNADVFGQILSDTQIQIGAIGKIPNFNMDRIAARIKADYPNDYCSEFTITKVNFAGDCVEIKYKKLPEGETEVFTKYTDLTFEDLDYFGALIW